MDEVIFDCIICSDKLDDAMETKCCHHCFCKHCINEWMRVKKSCPSCRTSITAQDIVPNVPIQRMINNLPAECPNKSRGCTSKLTRGIVREHALNSCEFAEIQCPNKCGRIVLKRDLSVHQNNVCLKRLAPCTQCALMVTVDVMLEHLKKCLKAQVLCTDCNKSLARDHLHLHQQRECMKITLKCPFAQFGCQFTGLRPQYNKHLIEESDLHAIAIIEGQDKMSKEIAELKNEVAKLKNGEKDPMNVVMDFGNASGNSIADRDDATEADWKEQLKDARKLMIRYTAKVSSVSLTALFGALKQLPELRELCLDRCTLNEDCVTVLTKMLPKLDKCKNLGPIWFKYCTIPKSCQEVIRAIEFNSDYPSIFLSTQFI